jgi:hypothetical protein
MAPMKKRVEKEGGKKKMNTVEVKKEIIGKHKQGMQVAAIARFYKTSKTISTILQKKEELRGLDVQKETREYQSNGHVFWKM